MVNLIAIISLLIPSYLLRLQIGGIPTTVLEILIWIAFIVGLVRAYQTGFRKIPVLFWAPIALLMIALIISVFIAPDRRAALGEFKGFFVDPIIFSWLVFQFVKEKDVPKVFWGLFISAGLVALQAIYQKLTGNVTTDERVVGIFGYSPNYLSLFLAPIVVLQIGYAVKKFREKNRWAIFAIILALIELLAIQFSGSRGGFLAILSGVGIFCIAAYWSWIKNRISAIVILSILILMGIYTSWTFFRPDFSVSPESGGRVATSNNLRWQIWQTTFELGKKHPILGVGLGNYQNAFGNLTESRANFPEYITPMALTPHNIYLMFWLSTGLLGLISFLGLIVIFYRQVILQFGKYKYSKIILATMTAILCYGFIESSVWKNDLGAIFWLLWGLSWVI